jgi:hypothetical protein
MHTTRSGRKKRGHRCQLAAEQGRAVPHRHCDRVNDPSKAAVAHVRELGMVGKTEGGASTASIGQPQP